MLTTENRGLHFLFEDRPPGRRESFVAFCSECTCVLRVSRRHIETGNVIESLINRCPGCGAVLERAIAERTMTVAEHWGDISLSVNIPRAPKRNFVNANELRNRRWIRHPQGN